MNDAEKLHQIKLLAQDWHDSYDGYDSYPDIETAAELILEIIDPDNRRLKPPPPPSPEQLAERARSAEEWRARMAFQALAASDAVVGNYLAECKRLGIDPPKDLTKGDTA